MPIHYGGHTQDAGTNSHLQCCSLFVQRTIKVPGFRLAEVGRNVI